MVTLNESGGASCSRVFAATSPEGPAPKLRVSLAGISCPKERRRISCPTHDTDGLSHGPDPGPERDSECSVESGKKSWYYYSVTRDSQGGSILEVFNDVSIYLVPFHHSIILGVLVNQCFNSSYHSQH